MGLRLVRFFTLILIALALVPAGAHLFELPNKIGLPQDQYFVVQNIIAAGRCWGPCRSQHWWRAWH